MKNGVWGVLLQLAPALLFRKQVSFVCARCMLGVLSSLVAWLRSNASTLGDETQPAWASEKEQNEGCKLVWETSPYTTVSCSWYLCVASPPCRTLHRFFLLSIPLIASSSSSPWNKCYCLQPSNCAWPQYKLLFTTIGYISLCCVMCVCVVM